MAHTLTLTNTLGNAPQIFAPVRASVVSIYTCGPTVYDFAHIGNFRSFLAADVLRRWLDSSLCQRCQTDGTPEPHTFGQGGYNLTHVMNITDVGHMTDDDAIDAAGDDKMEIARKRLLEDKKAGKLPQGVDLDPTDPFAIAGYYAEAFINDARTLGMRVIADADTNPDLLPRATRMVKPMLELIATLLESQHAYIADDGVCYFDTQKFPDYGQLSGNTLEAIRSGAGGRVAESTQSVKHHPADFMLWKPDPTHLMRWDPAELLGKDIGLGPGYPGWHIECSAMAYKVFNQPVIDLHSGGEDNIFPHHECEIAQSRCAHGTDHFARYWFHPRFLFVEGTKMSKSKGNFFTVRDLLAKGFSPAAIRFELIKTHYRTNANFTEQGLVNAQRTIERWHDFIHRAGDVDHNATLDTPVARSFAQAMNDDLSVGTAIGIINSWLKDTPNPTPADAAQLAAFDHTLGVLSIDRTAPASTDSAKGLDDNAIHAKLDQRIAAKKSKDFATADAIRDELLAAGIEIKDGPDGTTWTRKASL